MSLHERFHARLSEVLTPEEKSRLEEVFRPFRQNPLNMQVNDLVAVVKEHARVKQETHELAIKALNYVKQRRNPPKRGALSKHDFKVSSLGIQAKEAKELYSKVKACYEETK